MPKHIVVKDVAELRRKFIKYCEKEEKRQFPVNEAVRQRLEKVYEQVKSDGDIKNQVEMRTFFRAVLKIMKMDYSEYIEEN